VTSLDMYLVFILVSVEIAVSQKYVVTKGNKTLTVLLDNSGAVLNQKDWSDGSICHGPSAILSADPLLSTDHGL